ncbi:MAG: translation initiation factor IF-3 [Butyrivibrio sp.]|nr:translation initiation factor IF-3 [Butyrivibrio sp.]
MIIADTEVILCPFFISIWRCTVINNKDYKVNEDIRDKEIRVIGSDGSQLGILATKDALEKAYDEDKDLVMIAPNAQPPVCKIMDFGKFLFEQSKREKEAKKNQKVMDVKEVKMSSTIDTHDFETKVNQAMKFLKNGDRLKVEVRFRKRTVAHPQFGEELLKKFAAAVSEIGVVDKQPKMEGRSFVMYVSPKSTK